MSLTEGLPGETPIDDVSGLIPKHIKTRAELNIAEISSMARAIAKYLGRRPTSRMAPFTRSWMYKLHREMFAEVWTWAGKRRKSDYSIGLDWIEIDIELEELARDIAYWAEHGGDANEQAAIIHYRSGYIHPFPNGNGRWARLLGQIWQYRQTGTYAKWPDREISGGVTPIRQEYLDTLKAADAGDIGPLIAMQNRFTTNP